MALLAAPACERKPEALPPGSEVVTAAPAAAPRVQVIVARQGGWNQVDSIRVRLENPGSAALPASRLLIRLPHGLALLGAALNGDSVAAAADSTEAGRTLVFSVPALAPRATHRLAQGLRLPPSPTPPPTAPVAFPIRVEWSGVTPAPAPVADSIGVNPGSAVAAGGCAVAEGASAQRYGVGPVRVRMPLEALRAACPEARDSSWRVEGSEERGVVVNLGGAPVLAELEGERVTRVSVADPRVRTATGLGVGLPLSDLRARLGRGCAASGEDGVYVWFPAAPGISFALDTAVTREWVQGGGGAVEALPESARVTRYVIHGQDGRCPAQGAETP